MRLYGLYKRVTQIMNMSDHEEYILKITDPYMRVSGSSHLDPYPWFPVFDADSRGVSFSPPGGGCP